MPPTMTDLDCFKREITELNARIECLSRDLAAARREIAELRERIRALTEAGQQ